MVFEECIDSFYFCYINGNVQQYGYRKIKFQFLKVVYESNDDVDIENSEDRLFILLFKIIRSFISEFNQKLYVGYYGKKGCCFGKRVYSNKLNLLFFFKNFSMRQIVFNRKVILWKQVKFLKFLGKVDMMLDVNCSSSMFELYVQVWQFFIF